MAIVTLKKAGQYQKHARQCNKLKKTVEQYAMQMGLDDSWRIDVEFHALKDDTHTVGHCTTEWHYRLVMLTLDLVKSKKLEADVDAVIRHELLHVPCWRIYELIHALIPDKEELISKYEEELVTFLEYMPIWQGEEKEGV